MKAWCTFLKIFVVGLSHMAVGGCGYMWRTQDAIDTQHVNLDEPVTTATMPDQVRSETVHFAHDGSAGNLVVTLTREAEIYDIQTDTVNRQIYQESGYGKGHKQWPVWVDAVTGSVLMIGGGTALALGVAQDTETDIEYRTNPDTGQREQREVPNSSNQDAFLVAGGAGVGVSIPFIVSAIHNGVKTKDKKVGTPKRTDIETEINQRTITAPLANVPVTIELPAGRTIETVSDADGRVTIDLSNEDDLFPLAFVAHVIVPSMESRYDIPANADTLALLPPTVRAKAEALADEVRKARTRYQLAISNDFLGIWGHEWTSNEPPYGSTNNYLAFDLLEDGRARFILMSGKPNDDFDRAVWKQSGDTIKITITERDSVVKGYTWGFTWDTEKLCYAEKVLYPPNEPICFRREGAASSSHTRIGEKSYNDALLSYLQMLPTDPFDLKPAPQKEGKR